MSNPEMNTAWQERAQAILKARQNAKKSEWKLREPTIPEIRAKLKAIRKQVEKDYGEYQVLVAWILKLVEMAFKKVKD